MDLADALHLRDETITRLSRRRGVRAAAAAGPRDNVALFEAAGFEAAGPLRRETPLVSLGAAPGATARAWRVAVRARDRSGLDLPEIVGLRVAAAREVDERITGVVRAPRDAPRAGQMQGRVRPLRAGHSVAHVNVTAGTLGAFVEDQQGNLLVLSNNHVLAATDAGAVGDPILQPGNRDGGRNHRDHVGELKRWVRLRERNNVVDAAVCSVFEDVEPDDLTLPGIGLVDRWWTQFERAVFVNKVGRTTGLTRGKVTALGLRNLDVDYHGRVCRFDQVIEVKGVDRTPVFSDGGDSGSLVVDDTRTAVGLLFAGDDEATFVNPIAEVLSALQVRLVT